MWLFNRLKQLEKLFKENPSATLRQLVTIETVFLRPVDTGLILSAAAINRLPTQVVNAIKKAGIFLGLIGPDFDYQEDEAA